MLAPVLPFITENIYQNLACNTGSDLPESVHLCDYPIADQDRIDDELMQQVDGLRKLVELGRSARNQAGLKIRQPLAKLAYIIKDDVTADFIQEHKSVILEELNVKAIERVNESSQLLSYRVKPNLPVLGPKYGKLMDGIQRELSKLPVEDIKTSIDNSGQIHLTIDSSGIILEVNDLLIDKTSAAGYTSTSDGEMTVGLVTELSEELIQEGIVRDVIRQVQIMRKKAKFAVEDRINIYGTFDGPTGAAIMANKEYFYNETLTQELIPELQPGEYSETITVRDWSFTIAIKRVKKG